jgi:hypothetical protein
VAGAVVSDGLDGKGYRWSAFCHRVASKWACAAGQACYPRSVRADASIFKIWGADGSRRMGRSVYVVPLERT